MRTVVQSSYEDRVGHTVIWVARFAADGAQHFLKEFGRAKTASDGKAVAIDSKGGIVVGGTNVGGIERDSRTGSQDIVLFRLDADGNRK